jgi:hypothetical protein
MYEFPIRKSEFRISNLFPQEIIGEMASLFGLGEFVVVEGF